MNHVIGLGGPYQSGKDTVADYLVAQHGFVKLGMSDVLNDFVAAIDPILYFSDGYGGGRYVRYAEYVKYVGYVAAKENSEVRRLLQTTGTEAGRKILGEDVWVNGARRRIEQARLTSSVVMTGIRFPNEVDMIRELLGSSWWVSRPGFAGDSHASERSVTSDDFDYLLSNDTTIAKLHEHTDYLLDISVSEIAYEIGG